MPFITAWPISHDSLPTIIGSLANLTGVSSDNSIPLPIYSISKKSNPTKYPKRIIGVISYRVGLTYYY
jgi:hypothetical protein